MKSAGPPPLRLKKPSKKIFRSLFKISLKGLIIFQLIALPYALALPPRYQNGQESYAIAEQFNRDHVLSLRNLIFGSDSGKNEKGYYENHPLDLFSLLGQSAHPVRTKYSEADIKSFLINLSEKTQTEHTGIYESAMQLLKTITSSTNGDYHPDFYKKLEQLFVQVKEANISPFSESTQRLLKQLSAGHYIKHIEHKNLIVEIIEDSEDKTLKAVLSYPDKLPLTKAVLNPDKANLFTGSFFDGRRLDSQKKLSFLLSLHGKVIHSFPQNILWMAFFDSYLVFLEPSKVSEHKALISFIDLNYFEKAIGKTSLPIFYLPLHFESTGIEKEKFLSPEKTEIKTTSAGLLVGDIEVSGQQMDYISQLQQLSFNATVSMVDPAGSKISQEFLKELVKSFEERLQPPVVQTIRQGRINLETKKHILKLLEHRRAIGSHKDPSGNYGQLKEAVTKLNLRHTEDELSKSITESLKKDSQFQQAVEQTYKNAFGKEKTWSRAMAFFNLLTRPQPLGAPKIKKALGLIANSVLPGETVQSRYLGFKEGMAQLLYPNNNRFLGVTVLAGAGALASPTIAQYFISAFSLMGVFFVNWAEIFSLTIGSSFEWASLDGLYESYIKDDKFSHFMTGLAGLFTVALTVIGGLHIGANSYDLIKHLKSKEEVQHRKTAVHLREKLSLIKNSFIKYMRKSKRDFIENLSNAEKRKLGIIVDLSFGLDNTESRLLLKTLSNLNSLYGLLEKEDAISLKMEFQETIAENTEKQEIALKFKSSTRVALSEPLKDNQLSLSLRHASQNVHRVFTLSEDSEYPLTALIQDGRFKPKSLELKLSAGDTHISGISQNADFSPEDHERLNKILSEIEIETGKSLTDLDVFETKKEITTLQQALLHFAVGSSSWAKTFRLLGLGWNWGFLARGLWTGPNAWARMAYYSRYFNITYKNRHFPTVFNGGRQNRLNRQMSVWKARQKGGKKAGLRQALKEFEDQVMKIEKQFWTDVTAQTYLEAVKQEGLRSEELAHGTSLKNWNIKNKKARMFHMLYQRELFQEVMRDYLAEQLGEPPGSLSDGSLKHESFVKLLDGDMDFPELTDSEVRERVLRVAGEHKISQRAKQAVNHFLSDFFKKAGIRGDEKGRKFLDPQRNMQFDRFNTAERLLNDPEGLARATRQQLSNLIIDKPIEVLFKFLILAGVDQGVLKVLHDQPFTEEAWFHFSRYAIWTWFAWLVIADVIAGAWFKVQMDQRLDDTGGFDNIIPTKEDVDKKFGYLRWLKKQFQADDNSFLENYSHSIKVAVANLPANLPLQAAVFAITLGRFDLEIYLSALLIVGFGSLGLTFKIENTFEKSVYYSLKDLIAKGMDFKEKDRHFLSHPLVQAIKLKEGNALRRKFNFWKVLLYENPVGNMLDVLQNINSSVGSRAFSRMFFGGSMPTEYWVSFMDFLENKNIMSPEFTEKCKSIFTNNRTDI